MNFLKNEKETVNAFKKISFEGEILDSGKQNIQEK